MNNVATKPQTVDIRNIRTDGGTQSRAHIDGPTVYEYAGLMRDGVEFPPIVVYYDGSDYWLADGFHRVAAHREARPGQSIRAEVFQGERRDAVLHSVGANASHGLRRTNADKRRAVETLLRDEEWSKWSDREIARRVGVSNRFVSNMREEMVPSVNGSQTERVVERNGTQYTMKTPEKKHWADTPAPVFWSNVKNYHLTHLEPQEILGRIQKGAKRLIDLNMSKQEAHQALRTIALEEHGKRFQTGQIVKHRDRDEFGRVVGLLPETMDVESLRNGVVSPWGYSFVVPSSRDEWEQHTNQGQPRQNGSSVLESEPTRVTKSEASALEKHAIVRWHAGDEVITRRGRGRFGVVVHANADRMVLVKDHGGGGIRQHYADTLRLRDDPGDSDYISSTINHVIAYGIDDPSLAEAFDRVLRYAGSEDVTEQLPDDLDLLIGWFTDLRKCL